MTGVPLKYYAAAVFVGVIFAFGLASMMHQPLPVQVQQNQYQPAAPPAPAIPTIAPAVTVTGNPFAPAPAPVIVTTAPLPTITPVPINPTPTATLRCSVDQNSPATSLECTQIEVMGTVQSMMGFMMWVFPFTIIFSIFASMLARRGGGDYG
jgi:hypothetical protein